MIHYCFLLPTRPTRPFIFTGRHVCFSWHSFNFGLNICKNNNLKKQCVKSEVCGGIVEGTFLNSLTPESYSVCLAVKNDGIEPAAEENMALIWQPRERDHNYPLKKKGFDCNR